MGELYIALCEMMEIDYTQGYTPAERVEVYQEMANAFGFTSTAEFSTVYKDFQGVK